MPDVNTTVNTTVGAEVLRFKQDVPLKQLQEVLAEFVALRGCPACGLNGSPIHLEIDPRIRYVDFVNRFDSLVAVERVSFTDRVQVGGFQQGFGG